MAETVTMATSHQDSSNFSQTLSTQEALFHPVDRAFASVSRVFASVIPIQLGRCPQVILQFHVVLYSVVNLVKNEISIS